MCGKLRVALGWLRAGVAVACCGWQHTGWAQALSAQAAVESESVYVGQPFAFQIQVSGSDSLPEPDLSGLTDFQVNRLGGGSTSNTSMAIINGRMSREIRRGYTFSYELTAKRAGTLVIPSIVVREGNTEARTQPVQITAAAPQEVADFRLRMELSKGEAYVGEPLILDITFYYKADVQNPQLGLPVMDLAEFQFFEQAAPTDETADLDGQQFRTMHLRKALIPKKAGDYQLPASTLSFQGMVGFRTMQDLFFGPAQRRDFRRFVIPSNSPRLKVLELPSEGRPANFAGHVGEFHLEAKAAPLNVNVGDPITLTLSVSGPPFLAQVSMPPLQKQPSLVRDFRLPAEAAAGKVEGQAVHFTQTIRALRPEVREIPAIELPYFDPVAKSYRLARSAPIPLEVRSTRVVTAGDAEGRDPLTRQMKEIQEATGGIAYNYEDRGALRHQGFDAGAWLRSGGFWSLLLIPPALYGLLWYLVWRWRLQEADPAGVRERRAQAGFAAEIGAADTPDAVLAAFRAYLRDKLHLGPGVLTVRDVEPALRARGVDVAALDGVRQIFEACERSRYAGVRAGDVAGLAAQSRAVVEQIEKVKPSAKHPAWARICGVLLAVLPGSTHGALSPAEADSLFKEGNALFHQANEAAPRDGGAASELYGKAILRFERLIREGGIENGKLYYNVANAYFRMNDVGHAILNYRRALELLPHDANLVRNLAYARQMRIDKIEASAPRRVAEILLFWHHDLTARIKAVLFGWSVVLAWGCLAGALFRYPALLRRTAAGCGAVALLMLISLVVEARTRNAFIPGVITASEVVARKGDGMAYEPSFQEPLHAGTEFRLLESRSGWRLVELGDGRKCWLPEKASELVRDPVDQG